MTQKRRTTRKNPVRRARKKGSTSFFSKLRSIPFWGILLGGVGVLAIYCYILFHFFVDPYSFQWKAIYGETKYPQGYHIRGIDISHYQQDIDWQKLRNANMDKDPVTFVIIKATEGNTMIDEYFNDNFYQANRHASSCVRFILRKAICHQSWISRMKRNGNPRAKPISRYGRWHLNGCKLSSRHIIHHQFCTAVTNSVTTYSRTAFSIAIPSGWHTIM